MIEFWDIHWQEIVGTILGFLYLYFELKAQKVMFPTGILMSAFYIGVFISSGFYAFAGINVYFIFAQIYAWWNWNKNSTQETIALQHIEKKSFIIAIASTLLLFVGLWWILLQVPNESQLAWGDSFVTSLNIVALWMLAKGYVEQWLLLILANFISIFLFYHQNLYSTTILYFVFFIASIYGYYSWGKMVKKKSA